MIKDILTGFTIMSAFALAVATIVALVWAIVGPDGDCPPWIKWPLRMVGIVGLAYILGWATLHK